MRALLVDLNNFARYPTLAIGYLVAALRGAGIEVTVLSPLSHGVPALERERQESRWDQLQRRVYFSTHPATVRLHDMIRSWRTEWVMRPNERVAEETRRALDARKPDILLLSAYLDHYASVRKLGGLARSRGVPMLLGGPMFNVPEITHEWLDIPGLAAVVGAEVDLNLPELVRDVVEGRDLLKHRGVFLPSGAASPPAPPLHALHRLPTPDFSDFPWDRYPGRVIPIMTGRGCSWGRCQFCADVQTANGRGFRSRPVSRVLDEVEEQAERHGTRDVIFLDIKLNSDLEMWRGIIDGFQERLPGGRWIGTVHVQAGGDNGLSRDELRAAREAGLTRTTFGLETGSQRLNDSMAKGTRLEQVEQFIHDADEAGISVRTTAMSGYPGESADDIDATVKFLEHNQHHLDRVRLSRFKAIPGTRFGQRYNQRPNRFADLKHFEWNYRFGRARYDYGPSTERRYRQSRGRLLAVVHQINRRPLRPEAEPFDGLM